MKHYSLLILLSALSAWANVDEDLLVSSDRARGGLVSGVIWQATITTVEDKEKSVREYEVKVKGDDAFVDTRMPTRNKGEVFLFKNRNMWFFKPGLRKPVSISSRQKLIGQAANGDIASTNYSRDYTPTFVSEEIINGIKTRKLLLKAKSKEVTYDQIHYWISPKTKLAVQAEFLTLQGKPFKKASFEYENQLPGSDLPFVSKMVIEDSKFPENKSIIEYNKPQLREHARTLFDVDSLSR